MPPMGGVTGAMKGTGGSMGKKKERPKNTKNTIIRLFSYMKETKLQLAGALCCVLASTVSTLAASYMLRPVINNYIIGFNENGGIKSLAMALVVMASVYLLGVLATYFQAKLMLKVSQRAMFSLRRDLFVHMQKLPVSFFDMNSKGDLMSRYTNDVDVVGEMLNSTAVQLFSGIMTLVGTFAMMIYTNIWLSLITFVMAPVIIYSGRFLVSRSRKYYAAQQKSLGALNGCIEETISGQRVVKVFCHEKQAVEDFKKYNYDLKGKQIKAQFFGGIMGPVMGNMGQVSYSLTAAIGGILCVLRGFDIGGLTVFVNYSRQFSRPINEVAMQVNTIFSALAGAERVFAVMDEAPEAEDVENAITIEETEDGKHYYVIPKANVFVKEHGKPEGTAHENELNYYAEVKGAVTLKDVTFGYLPDKTILKHISLYAKPGQKIAFVGSTGAGKTTITNLINRFYDIDSGQILMDGFPITQIARDSLRRNIAMVLQDTHLFTGTVRENIRYGRLDATDEEVEQAAKMASAHSFIIRLEHGYDTVLEGDGANLSQGQRQLINIARAAISKAPILILDEATSSVDTRTEKHIEKGMDRLMAERTTLVIAHRLSTVRDANAIMVLEQGEIIERGDHDALLAQNGRYHELYTGKTELD